MATTVSDARTLPLQGHRIGITSVFGDPLDPRTWSGAPSNLAAALRALGAETVSIDSGPGSARKSLIAIDGLVRRGGRLLESQHLRRDAAARTHGARIVARIAEARDLDDVLHTGTFDLPAAGRDGRRHFLYCDHTWDLTRHRLDDVGALGRAFLRRAEALESASYDGLAHIFTFGAYVRDNLVAHYGVPESRVTAVGSGMGSIVPYTGTKDYANGPLLFVAKHLFVEKGGALLMEAFRKIRRARPETRLEIVARTLPASFAVGPGVTVHAFLPWHGLQELYRDASLLVQPMLNDPWGQVYLEALASRTPVVGLARNGLPEIVEDGRLGFLVPEPDPVALAETVLNALSGPDRLDTMGREGQRRVMASYSWDRVARRMAAAMAPRAAVAPTGRDGTAPPLSRVTERTGTWAARSH